MKQLTRKQKNYIIIGVIILLCIITAVVLLTRKDSTLEQNFHIEDTRKITRIVMEDRDGNKTDLKKTNDSVWTVNNDFQAAPMMVNTLLETLRDMRVKGPVAKAAHANIVKTFTIKVGYNGIYSTGSEIEIMNSSGLIQKREAIDYLKEYNELYNEIIEELDKILGYK